MFPDSRPHPSAVTSCRTGAARSWGLVALAGLLAACSASTPASTSVAYALQFEARQGHEQIQDLSAIVGGEKFYLGSLQPGEKRHGSFQPGPADDHQLHLLFHEAGQRRYWLGPAVAANVGYRIEVKLLDGHAIRFRHCALPCALDQQPWIGDHSAPND